jgi:ring-1,2-phenylacetyl-CoA epoxidase subunit PaaD
MRGAHVAEVAASTPAQVDWSAAEREVVHVLAQIPDPEIPVLSIVDLGIVRYVRWRGTRGPHVGITPTYTGCPATEVIRAAVRRALVFAGYADAVVEEVLSPPWTSAWLTAEGRRKLEAYGIAPPVEAAARGGSHPVACPRCASFETRLVSEFGSTPCKAHYRCNSCLEPFDHFKCI